MPRRLRRGGCTARNETSGSRDESVGDDQINLTLTFCAWGKEWTLQERVVVRMRCVEKPCQAGRHETVAEAEKAQAQRITDNEQRTKARESRGSVMVDRTTTARTEAAMVSNTDEGQASRWQLRSD